MNGPVTDLPLGCCEDMHAINPRDDCPKAFIFIVTYFKSLALKSSPKIERNSSVKYFPSLREHFLLG